MQYEVGQIVYIAFVENDAVELEEITVTAVASGRQVIGTCGDEMRYVTNPSTNPFGALLFLEIEFYKMQQRGIEEIMKQYRADMGMVAKKRNKLLEQHAKEMKKWLENSK